MNANSRPKMPAISEWLKLATHRLKYADIPSARLDAELILAHTLRKNRTYLHAHIDQVLTGRELEIAEARLALRTDRVPVAYIIGHKEFYGRLFHVTTATLIPRPESEVMIDLLKKLVKETPPRLLGSPRLRLIDVGTGSGCLGISAKLELPELDVTLADVSRHALAVATKNSQQLQADVALIQSDLLTDFPIQPDFILANLPYVNPEWELSPELKHEPALALFADDNGLRLIKKLIQQASTQLAPGGYLLLEADTSQLDAISAYASDHTMHETARQGFIITLKKD
ncbi:Release factor glutamine methyltransferase [compost metagenome]